MDQAYTAVGVRRFLGYAGAAIDRDLMPPFGEPDRELLGKGLEATVASWDAAGSENDDVQSGYLMGVDLSVATPDPRARRLSPSPSSVPIMLTPQPTARLRDR